MKIVSNYAVSADADSGVAYWRAPPPSPNYWVQAVIGQVTLPGVVLRYEPGVGTAYFLFTNAPTQFQLYRYNAGAGSLLANIDAGALTPGSTSIKMSITGTGASVTLKMYKDGVQVGSDIVDSDANRIVTAGYAGMHGFGATNGVASWSAGLL